MASARYWRFIPLVAPGTMRIGAVTIAAAGFELRGTEGGADLAAGGTASASANTLGWFAAANANDGNINTFWAANMTTQLDDNTWWKCDLGSAQTVAQVAITGRNDGSVSQAPCVWLIQSSADDSTWTGRGLFVQTSGWSVGETKTFTLPASFGSDKRGWRCVVDRVAGANDMICAELIMRDVPAGDQVVFGIDFVAFANSYNDADQPFKLFDGNTGTYWYEGINGPPYTIGGWTNSYTGDVTELTWTTINAGGFNAYGPTEIIVQHSVDGLTWETADTLTPAAWTSAGQSQTFDVAGSSPPPSGGSLTTLFRTSTASTFRR